MPPDQPRPGRGIGKAPPPDRPDAAHGIGKALPPDRPDAAHGIGKALPPDRPDPAQGVYETLLLRDGRVAAVGAHLDRLAGSVQELYGLPLPAEERARLIHALTEAAGKPGEQRARIDAHPHNGGLHLSVVVSEIPARRPVTLAPVVVPRGLGAHKWCDRRLVERHGSDPVPLLVDSDGSVLEAGWANVWALDGERLITPPLDGRILPGVTRARLLALAPSLGLHTREQPISLADARAATTMFLTSSLRVAVAASFDRHPHESPAVDRIRDALLFASFS